MRQLLISICCIMLLVTAAHGQTITGTIQGTVRDPSGAVLPGVTIRVKNIDTNQARETLSNESGTYFIPLLPVGHYEVSAELPGFKADVKTGIELQVDQRLNFGFTLQVGQMSEKLTVSEAAPLVQADSATVGGIGSDKRHSPPERGLGESAQDAVSSKNRSVVTASPRGPKPLVRPEGIPLWIRQAHQNWLRRRVTERGQRT